VAETVITKGRMNKNRDEPIRVIIHIYMEMSQGNSLYSYINLNTGGKTRSLRGRELLSVEGGKFQGKDVEG
jgi:hypothetical protein